MVFKRLPAFLSILGMCVGATVVSAYAQDPIKVKLTPYEIKQLNGIASRDKAVSGMLNNADITKVVVGQLKGLYMIWFDENIKAYRSAVKKIDVISKSKSCNDLNMLALQAEPEQEKVDLFNKMASARGCN